MKSIKTPLNACLACGHKFNRASSPFTNKDSPKEGDISICLKCGHLMVFNKDFSVRELTKEEMIEVAANKQILAIQRARGQLRS